MPVQERRGRRTSASRTDEVSPVPKAVASLFAGLRKIVGRPEAMRECVREPSAVSHRGTWHLEVCVEPDDLDGGFIAECVDMPGAIAQGETEQEAIVNLLDAIQGVVAVRMEDHVRTLDFGGSRGGVPPRAARKFSLTF